MTKILTSLLIAAVLSCSVVFAQDNFWVVSKNRQQGVEFALHGKTGCVLVNDKILCAPSIARAPVKLASTVSR